MYLYDLYFWIFGLLMISPSRVYSFVVSDFLGASTNSRNEKPGVESLQTQFYCYSCAPLVRIPSLEKSLLGFLIHIV